MIDPHEDLLLTDADFPSSFKHFAHPDDYTIVPEPIVPVCIFHSYLGGHNRLIYRTSVCVSPGKYFTLSFICDTGAPKSIYLSRRAVELFRQAGLVQKDDDTDVSWVTIARRKTPIDLTPNNHTPANILGLRVLCKLGLQLDENSFSFKSAPEYF